MAEIEELSLKESVIKERFVVSDNVEDMDTDGNGKRISEQCFLRRVLRKEFHSYDVNNKKLLVVGVHAVFLESGFVGFDSVCGLRIDGLHLADETLSMAVKLSYTLPDLLKNTSVKNSVYLKFHSVDQFVNVYGSFAKDGSGLHQVCLDENRFAQALMNVWQNRESDDEEDVFEFWKIVKNGLARPLLIELCDKTGLALPPCFMRLPAALKLKILEYLPGVDVARMGFLVWKKKEIKERNEEHSFIATIVVLNKA